MKKRVLALIMMTSLVINLATPALADTNETMNVESESEVNIQEETETVQSEETTRDDSKLESDDLADNGRNIAENQIESEVIVKENSENESSSESENAEQNFKYSVNEDGKTCSIDSCLLSGEDSPEKLVIPEELDG